MFLSLTKTFIAMIKKITLVAALSMAFNASLSAQTVPNGDFEAWTPVSLNILDKWANSNRETVGKWGIESVTKVSPAQNGSFAVQLKTIVKGPDTNFAYMSNSFDDVIKMRGGTPFTQKPTTLEGFYKSDIKPGDSAIVLVGFKKSGIPLGNFNMFKLGGIHSSYTPFSFQLDSLVQNPDSIVIAFASSDAFDQSKVKDGSWIILDNISFGGPGITENVPNPSFETWTTDTWNEANLWHSSNPHTMVPSLDKTTDKHSGTYAAKVTTESYGDGKGAFLSLGMLDWDQNSSTNYPSVFPGMPLMNNPDTIYFYYKFIPAGNGKDTAHVQVFGTKKVGQKRDSVVTEGWMQLMPSPNYQLAKLHLTKKNGGAIAPDSLTIYFQTSSNSNDTNVNVGTALFVDDISFQNWVVGIHGTLPVVAGGVMAYPNPSTGAVTFQVNAGNVERIELFDINGRMVNVIPVQGNKVINTQVDGPAGIYFFKVIKTDALTETGKIIVK